MSTATATPNEQATEPKRRRGAKRTATVAEGKTVYAGRWAMGFEYGLPGRTHDVDWGQVFESQNIVKGDERLLRLGYMVEMTGTFDTFDCPECGLPFVGDQQRRAHIKKRHVKLDNPEEQDEAIAELEEFAQQNTPLFFQNTTANLEAGPL